MDEHVYIEALYTKISNTISPLKTHASRVLGQYLTSGTNMCRCFILLLVVRATGHCGMSFA